MIGSVSGSAGLVLEKSGTTNVLYLIKNEHEFILNEEVTFVESGVTAIISSISAGDKDIRDSFYVDNGQRNEFYDFSRLINFKNTGNFYQNVIRDPRFFYRSNYISKEVMQRCIQEKSQNKCFKQYDISQIISAPNFIMDKGEYNCSKKTYLRGARNPLNRKKKQVEVCEKILLSK